MVQNWVRTGPLLFQFFDLPISMDSCIVHWWNVWKKKRPTKNIFYENYHIPHFGYFSSLARQIWLGYSKWFLLHFVDVIFWDFCNAAFSMLFFEIFPMPHSHNRFNFDKHRRITRVHNDIDGFCCLEVLVAKSRSCTVWVKKGLGLPFTHLENLLSRCVNVNV